MFRVRLGVLNTVATEVEGKAGGARFPSSAGCRVAQMGLLRGLGNHTSLADFSPSHIQLSVIVADNWVGSTISSRLQFP